MSNDRLGELAGDMDKYEAEANALETKSDFMPKFFESVNKIKGKIGVIRVNVKEIGSLHSSVNNASDGDKSSAAQKKVDALVQDTTGEVTEVKNLLKQLEGANKAAKAEAAEQKIRMNMTQTLAKSFTDLVTEFSEVQAAAKGQKVERVERQVKIVNPGASPEEIQAAVSGDIENIFAQAVMASPDHNAARAALDDIQEIHRDILNVERSIVALHQIFLDCSTLVSQQGELLGDIADSIADSLALMSEGIEDLQDAAEYQKSANKKQMMCMGIIFMGIAGAVCAAVFL